MRDLCDTPAMESPKQKSGTVTFLITDIVGSTEMLEQLGDEKAVGITMLTMSRLAEAAHTHGGEVIKNMGDGLMIVFTSARDAIAGAIAMQRAVHGEPTAEQPWHLPVRVGVHAGEPIRIGGDYFGMAVTMAFRICHVADGGQIVVSDLVHELTRSHGAPAFRELGERRLGGLRSPVRLWDVVWGDEVAPQASPAPDDRQVVGADRTSDAVVILLADIVDSVPQTERLGDAGFRERARELDRLLRSCVREHRGTTVDGKLLGDGILAIFPSARSAITCALQCGPLSSSVKLKLHLGIHAGDVIHEGNNIYGGAVNIAARISAATEPGEILVSDTVRGLARTSAGVSFDDRGEYTLKGIEEPQRLFTVRKL